MSELQTPSPATGAKYGIIRVYEESEMEVLVQWGLTLEEAAVFRDDLNEDTISGIHYDVISYG